MRARVSRGRRRAIREDSSEDEGPGPVLLRRGRFAALAGDDTESVDNHSPHLCAEEATQEVGCQEIPDGEDVRASCGRRPSRWTSVSRAHPPKSSWTARVRQAVRHPWQRSAPDVREVRAVIQVFRQLVGRVVPVDPQDDVPRAIRHQHWSAVFVPLMWAAACGDRECPVLQWLGHAAAGGPPIVVGGIEMPGEAATRGNVELGHPISRRFV